MNDLENLENFYAVDFAFRKKLQSKLLFLSRNYKALLVEKGLKRAEITNFFKGRNNKREVLNASMLLLQELEEKKKAEISKFRDFLLKGNDRNH